MESIQCLEGLQVLSRKYPFSQGHVAILEKLMQQSRRVEDATFFIMTFANQFLLFHTDLLPAGAVGKLSLSHLKRQLEIDGQSKFALNYLLFIFFKHEGMQWVNPDGDRIEGSFLQAIYTELVENQRLRLLYPNAINDLTILLTTPSHPLASLFSNLNQSGVKVDYYRLPESALLSKITQLANEPICKIEALHNFVRLGVQSNQSTQIMEALLKSRLGPTELFEVATRHFLSEQDLPLLKQVFQNVLGTESEVNQMFSGKDRLWRYMAVCFLLCDVLSPASPG